jgi:hypothetical protein
MKLPSSSSVKHISHLIPEASSISKFVHPHKVRASLVMQEVQSRHQTCDAIYIG